MGQVEASELVAALEVVWEAIQERHPDVPDVMVTLGAGSVGVPRGALKLGHFAADRWNTGTGQLAELFVGGEGLSRGAESVLATMLHEAAHGVAHVRKVKDTSREGRYHNARFKALGEELGLLITVVKGIGWSGTELAPGTAQGYAGEVHGLAAAITAWRYAEGYLPGLGGDDQDKDGGGEAGAGGRTKPKNGLVLVCACARKIRASVSVAELGPIICGVCASPFIGAL